MANHIIIAEFSPNKRTVIVPLKFYYDYGQILQFAGIDLPNTYEVHFANSKDESKATVVLGDENGVEIPSEYFKNKVIYAWLYMHETNSDGETLYTVKIPLEQRPKPDYEEPYEPEQEALITQAIATLNDAIDKTAANVTHYPTVIDDYWYVYDANTDSYVNTHTRTTGDKGDKGDKGDTLIISFYIDDVGDLIEVADSVTNVTFFINELGELVYQITI